MALDSGSMENPPFHVVLLSPEIPNNTGNIGRTCAATGCRLHIVHPIGFEMDEKALRRAGLDYWHMVDCVHHESWEAFVEKEKPRRLWLFTTRSGRAHWDTRFARGDYMLFGKETTGAPTEVHEWVTKTYGDTHRIHLPMDPGARSLNLATVVCAAVYEGLRQVSGRT